MNADDIDVLRTQNIANGKCPDCGGAGQVYDMRAIERTNNPHASMRCRTCRGTGLPNFGAHPDAV